MRVGMSFVDCLEKSDNFEDLNDEKIHLFTVSKHRYANLNSCIEHKAKLKKLAYVICVA